MNFCQEILSSTIIKFLLQFSQTLDSQQEGLVSGTGGDWRKEAGNW